MRCGIFQWVVVSICMQLVACGNKPPANQPKSQSDESDTVSSAPTQSESESTQAESTQAESTQAESETSSKGAAAKQRRPLDDLCDKIVDRAEQKCSKKVAGLYATSCRRYAKTDKCEQEITRALECQLKTTDELLCAHQADPNCTDARNQLKSCEKGTAPVEQTQAEDLTLPSGWEKINDSQLGFTVAMPRGATLDSKAAKRTWKADDGAITYIVAATDAPSGKLNNASILRTITNYVGTRCQLKLKVHGELELKGTTVVQYDSGCIDGTEWHGMMHFWNGNAVSTGFHGPAGAKGVLEPYYYSFALK